MGTDEQANARAVRTIDWDGFDVLIIDQTLLPEREEVIRLHEVAELAEAIRMLRVRGAMALGVAGGLGIALALRRAEERQAPLSTAIADASALLMATRPTATNLAWGIRQVCTAFHAGPEAALSAAVGLINADITTNRAIASLGADALEELVGNPDGPLCLLTHCNAGSLAGVEVGTALGVVAVLHRRTRLREVMVCETRPLLQGARLTSWELQRMGVSHRVLVDSAAATFITGGDIDAVVVGADRIAANGDVANKVGTLSHALAANYAGIPFIVLAPESTIDPDCGVGAEIPIELRAESEVLNFRSQRVAPSGTRAFNPAFDITPAGLVTAIVTEARVIRPGRSEVVSLGQG